MKRLTTSATLLLCCREVKRSLRTWSAVIRRLMWLFCWLIVAMPRPSPSIPHRCTPALSPGPSALCRELRSPHSVTVSFVGAAWRSFRGGEIDARIELDLSLRRAGEGGLALDASGRVFGMVVFGPRLRVLVIPAATIERVAATWKPTEESLAATSGSAFRRPGWMGTPD